MTSEEKPVVSLSAGVATQNSFLVTAGASTEQIVGAVLRIREIDGATPWWLGDLGIALQERKREELHLRAAELRLRAGAIDGSGSDGTKKTQLLEEAERMETRGVIEYTTELSTVIGVDDGYWNNCVSLARFYQPSFRNEGMTPKHHIVAMSAANGDRAKALKWLKEAKAEGLKASELRRRLAQETAVSRPPITPPEENEFEELCAADRWAMAYRDKAKTLTPRAALSILTMMSEIRALAFQLESVAKGMS